ncbi:MAG: radical SAM protein [Clostridia bacterium]|nr:radical SAM protein [Clostridia bacterium]
MIENLTKDGKCVLCPRNCGADREKGKGFCGMRAGVRISRVGFHEWEEPCISYGKGSGTVFFAGCNLKCVYCQNYEISFGKKGRDVSEKTLEEEILKLQESGASNINFVTPTHYSDALLRVLERIKGKLKIPVIYNCGGYEKREAVKALSDYIDVFLPDIKYFSPELSKKYSFAEDYFKAASDALDEMYKCKGYAEYDGDGHIKKGVLTRHLVLPSAYKDSIKILDYILENYDAKKFALSIVSQYFPTENCKKYPELCRRVTTLEYNKVVEHAENKGFENVYVQEKSSADEKYVPDFDY